MLDGTGDQGSISLYVVEDGAMRRLYCNDSVFDLLGAFYSVISSTQGGWTWLSSEGRYMGAAAWGDISRASNPYYARLKRSALRRRRRSPPQSRDGQLVLRPFRNPYKAALTEMLGPALKPDQLWNPDAVLRVEDIRIGPIPGPVSTRPRRRNCSFEDAMIHVVDHLLRVTAASRLVLTGGVALNAIGNMRLLGHFDEAWFAEAQRRDARLHLWVPPVPGDPGVTIGAAWLFAHLAGAPRGAPMTHAFYCGMPPSHDDIARCAQGRRHRLAADRQCLIAGRPRRRRRFDGIHRAQDGVIGLFQGAAETGPRALGHRSILANPCNPTRRERLNRLVKFREPFRPLAPMAHAGGRASLVRTA